MQLHYRNTSILCLLTYNTAIPERFGAKDGSNAAVSTMKLKRRRKWGWMDMFGWAHLLLFSGTSHAPSCCDVFTFRVKVGSTAETDCPVLSSAKSCDCFTLSSCFGDEGCKPLRDAFLCNTRFPENHSLTQCGNHSWTFSHRHERAFKKPLGHTWCTQTQDSSLWHLGNRTEGWLWASARPPSSAWWASLAVRGEKFQFAFCLSDPRGEQHDK